MEHKAFLETLLGNKIRLSPEKIELLCRYASLLYKTGKKTNLTGFKSYEKILKHLIADSILPLAALDVPRGTIFADIGSGPGIPGIPFGIARDDTAGTLIDSNGKKTDFAYNSIKTLGLKNLNVLCERIETIGHENKFRAAFGLVVSRALADIYTAVELGAPLVKVKGIMYIFSDKHNDSLDMRIIEHASSLGMSPLKDIRSFPPGIIFQKLHETDPRYPRKFSIIKRESKSISKVI